MQYNTTVMWKNSLVKVILNCTLPQVAKFSRTLQTEHLDLLQNLMLFLIVFMIPCYQLLKLLDASED